MHVASTMLAIRQGCEETLAAPAIAKTLVSESDGQTSEAARGVTRYREVTRLGEGGMGVVERVWDADLMRSLAVKRLKPELRSNASLVEQFLWEARIGAGS